ncbi:Verprolin [Trichinella spiralis]|uniref:Verprolin n=1 Tax=Trichinella spiralis TaxID=6334 RepID=A0ABR3KVR0_TRISP
MADKEALLAQIRSGITLRKVKTVDKSSPVIQAENETFRPLSISAYSTPPAPSFSQWKNANNSNNNNNNSTSTNGHIGQSTVNRDALLEEIRKGVTLRHIDNSNGKKSHNSAKVEHAKAEEKIVKPVELLTQAIKVAAAKKLAQDVKNNYKNHNNFLLTNSVPRSWIHRNGCLPPKSCYTPVNKIFPSDQMNGNHLENDDAHPEISINSDSTDAEKQTRKLFSPKQTTDSNCSTTTGDSNQFPQNTFSNGTNFNFVENVKAKNSIHETECSSSTSSTSSSTTSILGGNRSTAFLNINHPKSKIFIQNETDKSKIENNSNDNSSSSGAVSRMALKYEKTLHQQSTDNMNCTISRHSPCFVEVANQATFTKPAFRNLLSEKEEEAEEQRENSSNGKKVLKESEATKRSAHLNITLAEPNTQNNSTLDSFRQIRFEIDINNPNGTFLKVHPRLIT